MPNSGGSATAWDRSQPPPLLTPVPDPVVLWVVVVPPTELLPLPLSVGLDDGDGVEATGVGAGAGAGVNVGALERVADAAGVVVALGWATGAAATGVGVGGATCRFGCSLIAGGCASPERRATWTAEGFTPCAAAGAGAAVWW
jgi:hypothetical protein